MTGKEGINEGEDGTEGGGGHQEGRRREPRGRRIVNYGGLSIINWFSGVIATSARKLSREPIHKVPIFCSTISDRFGWYHGLFRADR
jgi:hypothetical protein